ncbi:hypothetical protein DGG96_02015 [Legionella qingyii]|uniref:Uncharacterized protein n=1 Tax=Legionella qingyii TaxID=2184757 RepID=A0A317U3H7_9GAMM|nr:hypothetical protein [Legionella qingyii]PWY56533.1 hypothetical protein DGG96_07175 [Legionella qingyii]PWY57110.1 hypothetical protein DGG96_02015 [Legionella qingyii]RUR25050.1 hypothetical protein ELY20_04660 [Legionella qingyii]
MRSKKENTYTKPIQLENPQEDDSVTIFVWSTGLNSLGHVSMKFSDNPGHYLSIWPKSTPAGGLTSIWPLKATSATKLEDDCLQEAIRPTEDFANLMEPFEIVPLQPDKVFVVHGLDKQKMINEFTRIKNGFDTGEVCYQLLPGVKASDFIHRILLGNPKHTEVYNCVTLTGHLLEAGGKSLINDPWATPSNFAEQLDNLDQVTSLNPAAIDTKNQSIHEDAPKTQAEPAAISVRKRLTNRWFSDDNFDDYTSSHEASDTRPEVPELVPMREDTPSPRVAESSLSFFGNGNNASQSFLQKRNEESDSSYLQRMDFILN